MACFRSRDIEARRLEDERGRKQEPGTRGPVGLVTGASSGLGRATAIALARAGVDIALVARSKEELDVEGWDCTLAANLRDSFLLSKATLPRMREAGGGTIVNVSSVAGKKGWAKASAYCASKFGFTGFTETLADEGKEHGIRASVLYPGAMATNWGSSRLRSTERASR